MDSYRVEKQAAVKILLPGTDPEIEPVPMIHPKRIGAPTPPASVPIA